MSTQTAQQLIAKAGIPVSATKDTFRLRDEFKIRFQHFYAKGTNRLTATIATRERNGLIDVAVAIAHPNQGKKLLNGKGQPIKNKDGRSIVEPAPSRAAGREESLRRLLLGNKLNKELSPMQALYILESGRNTELDGALFSPSDIMVVSFTQKELSREIQNRTILRFFPGKRWVPDLRPARQFDSSRIRKDRREEAKPVLEPVLIVPTQADRPSVLNRLKAFFGV